jgi:PPK2 family polyphosphate:nucleotide phosphotransferase
MQGVSHLIQPGSVPDLDAIDPDATGSWDKVTGKAALKGLSARIGELQERLYAEQKQSLLVILQAMDTGGKDGAIKGVFEDVNVQGVRVAAFGVPTEEELAHDFLWRIHKQTPAKGIIGVFNRSHYEDVLVVRVKNLAPEEVWRPRYRAIVDFERTLVESGTRVVKFFLHISKDEQKERLQARLDDPEKIWKFRTGDLEDRALWNDFQSAYREAIGATSTAEAPWYVIPANKKWHRNVAIAEVLVRVLEEMDPQFPPPEKGLDKVTIA